MQGKTPVTLNVSGLEQSGICQIKVRFATMELEPKVIDKNSVNVTTPVVSYPGQVVVQIAFNGQ